MINLSQLGSQSARPQVFVAVESHRVVSDGDAGAFGETKSLPSDIAYALDTTPPASMKHPAYPVAHAAGQQRAAELGAYRPGAKGGVNAL